jgi:hypothetical protein
MVPLPENVVRPLVTLKLMLRVAVALAFPASSVILPAAMVMTAGPPDVREGVKVAV